MLCFHFKSLNKNCVCVCALQSTGFKLSNFPPDEFLFHFKTFSPLSFAYHRLSTDRFSFIFFRFKFVYVLFGFREFTLSLPSMIV